ncbi:MAG TPA: Pycsar system effector family protein [Ignavibacteriaceae bacterium]|nr:Pycsar system effector family protein [Ignavibacteriaceae bacterium]
MNSIVTKACDYVTKLLQEQLPKDFVYHNLNHTIEVVAASKEIGEQSGLSPEEKEDLLVAAWFHDTGFVSAYNGHEAKSAEICDNFLSQEGFPQEKKNKITQLILSTRHSYMPGSLSEQIICDADILHIGKKGFKAKSQLLRDEWDKMLGKKFSDFEWYKNSIDFISSNKFQTEYARNNFEEQRKVNLGKLQKKLRKIINSETAEPEKEEKRSVDQEAINQDKSKNSQKENRYKQVERGIETMFRNTLRTHVEFSGMADSKANIMISVNTLLLTAIIAVLARKLDTNPHLIVPTIIITSVSLITLVFAVLVTRPKITSGTFTQEDIKQKRANLLFFGNFYKMDLENFQWGMNEMMKDREYLYGSMIKDFYFLGQVLGQKYKYLRICYNIFMYGLIISIFAFALAVLLYPGSTQIGPLID